MAISVEPVVDADGLEVPKVPSASAVEEAGLRMKQAADGVFDAMAAVKRTWTGLGSVFWVSGSEGVDAAMQGPELSTALFQENVDRARRALETLAVGYSVLSGRREELVERLAKVRARLATAEAEVEDSQVVTEFGEVATSDLLAAQRAEKELRADIARFHRDLAAEEEAFAAELAAVPIEDVVSAPTGRRSPPGYRSGRCRARRDRRWTRSSASSPRRSLSGWTGC